MHANITASQAVKTKTIKACEYVCVVFDKDAKISSTAKRASHAISLKKKNLFKSEVQFKESTTEQARII